MARGPGPEEARLVALLREGRWDEAGQDPDRIARAIGYYVESLSDPREVLVAAGYLWKGYPFSIADLEVDVELLERVAEREGDARAALEPASKSCRELAAVRDTAGARAFAGRLKGRHPDDGGRCARRLYRLLKDIAGRIETPRPRDVDELDSVLDLMEQAFGDEVFTLLAGFRLGEMGVRAGLTRREAFALTELELGGRWTRLLRGHLAWLRAHLFTWAPEWTEFQRAGEALRGEDSSLGRLGRALVDFTERLGECESGKDSREGLDRAVSAIGAAAPGSAFARAARFGRVGAWLFLGMVREALEDFRKRDAGDPEESPRILTWIALRLQEQGDLPGAKALMEEVLAKYSYHSASLRARVQLAGILLEEKQEERATGLLERVLRDPVLPFGTIDDESPAYARSDAARMLATVYEGRSDWMRALVLWREWVPATFCGTCSDSMESERRYHVGLALDHLGRAEEAMKEYWAAAPETEEAARKCRELHARLGTTDRLRGQVEEAVRKAREHDAELRGYPGLRWLEQSLKTP